MSFKLSIDSAEIIDRLKTRFKVADRPPILRLAFAKGLEVMPDILPPAKDSKGAEIPLSAIEDLLFDALIRQKFKIELTPKEKRQYYKAIIDYGAVILQQEDEYGDNSNLLLKLAKEADPMKLKYGQSKGRVPTVDLQGTAEKIILDLGIDSSGASVSITWNDKDATGQHLCITGKTGAGKTQFALELLTQIKEESKGKINVIFFDFAKGDVAANLDFVDGIDAKVIDVSIEGGVPFNPFFMDEVTPKKIEELKDIFTSVQRTLGPKQSLELFDILEACYDRTSEPDIYTVYDVMNEAYEEQGKSKDVLVELFHKLVIPEIFPRANSEGLHRTLCDKNLIFDLHNIDSHMRIKELIAFLILNKIYTEAIRMKDSGVDPQNNTREIRTVVVIDEAHNYLNCRNKVLEKMVRELRSKGVAIILLTQGFEDLDQKEFDYSTMLNWIFLMKSDNDRASIEKALAINKELASKLSTEISTAETGKVYTRKLRSKDQGYLEFESKQYWKRQLK